MIRDQMLCAMRPQEIRLIRSSDIDRSDNDIWVYIPHRHKTQHLKKHRTIPILPEGQAILMPYLIDKERQPEAYLFSPADAMKMIAVEKREKRKSKVQPSQQNRKKGTSQYNDHYTKDAYGTAIERACDRAGVPRWSPNQLRHTRATEVNAKLGIEAARILLGHSDSETTKIYLDSNALLKEQIQRTIENAREIRRVTEQM
jgi:integrase